MTITYAGKASYDPLASAILYDVSIDGAVVHCSFAKEFLAFCVDDFGDPLDIFNSCRLLMLEYTKYCFRKCGFRADGQNSFELESANGVTAIDCPAVLNVVPRYEDNVSINADCISPAVPAGLYMHS
jgi:hypothetical protein